MLLVRSHPGASSNSNTAVSLSYIRKACHLFKSNLGTPMIVRRVKRRPLQLTTDATQTRPHRLLDTVTIMTRGEGDREFSSLFRQSQLPLQRKSIQ